MKTATRELLFGPSPQPLRAEARVVIHVAGGGAHIVTKPAGVLVAVHDFDNPSGGDASVTVYRADVEIRQGEALPRGAAGQRQTRQRMRRGDGGETGIREEPEIAEVGSPSSERA